MKFITETKFVFLNQKLIYIFTERIYRIKITNFVFKNIKKNFIFEFNISKWKPENQCEILKYENFLNNIKYVYNLNF